MFHIINPFDDTKTLCQETLPGLDYVSLYSYDFSSCEKCREVSEILKKCIKELDTKVKV